MTALAFRLFGPLASWGTVEAGESVRPTADHPGRSSIFGLLAAALGWRRVGQDEAHAALAVGYDLAVASHGPRRLLRDYRTVQTIRPSTRQRKTGFVSRKEALETGAQVRTMITERYYVQDGLWRVFLWPSRQVAEGKPDETPDPVTLAAALRRPVFELYLGRRCCPPALPLDPQVIAADNLEGALEAYPAVPDGHAGAALGSGLHRHLTRRFGSLRRIDFDTGVPVNRPFDRERSVRDEPGSRSRWQFGTRVERTIFVHKNTIT